jgi:hypothetical protein
MAEMERAVARVQAGTQDQLDLVIQRAAAQDERWRATSKRQQEIITRLAEGWTLDQIQERTLEEVIELRLTLAAVERERDALRAAAAGGPVLGASTPARPARVVEARTSPAYGLQRKPR